ncbi:MULTISPECIES: GNAT family N-acetyltransferase [Corynebacterium]|nr:MULTISPECIES: GNAT family N-acetyltransferase [Corynebacterium]
MTSPRGGSQATFEIRPMVERDYPQVAEILQHGLDSGLATYEVEAPQWEDFTRHRIMDLAFVAECSESGAILGWITATPVSHRGVFDGVVEDSVYVSPEAAGRGVAGALLDKLLESAADQGYWKLHSSIFPENKGSIKLHESRGFVHVGTFRAMAKMPHGPYEGQWRDAYTMEKIVEKGPAWSEVDSPHVAAHELPTQE